MTKTNKLSDISNARLHHLFRGAVIDNNGREIPITEHMILDACRKLEAAAGSLYASMPREHAIVLRK